MIHAFVAGFAGAIGVLTACVAWNALTEWLAGAEDRHTAKAIAKAASRDEREAAWERRKEWVRYWIFS